MTEHSTGKRQRLEFDENIRRRRVTDKPHPLDYVTRELVKNIIEKRQQEETNPKKTFIQKLLGED